MHGHLNVKFWKNIVFPSQRLRLELFFQMLKLILTENQILKYYLDKLHTQKC